MKTAARVFLLGLLAPLVAMGCERKVTNEVTEIVSPDVSFYVGSDACQACHPSLHASFMKTGHPFKLNDADDVQDPNYYPFSTVQNPPDLAWSEIDLVIGGFWWKARYIRADGRIYTGPNRQYNLRPDNLAPPEFVKYETDTPGTKDYDCGRCHTTGYKAQGNQDGKPGLIGTWASNGIQCEACHGPGGVHANSPYDVRMVIDRSNELCGKCHVRGAVNTIPAQGGFIRHHEQWNEMFTTKHSGIQCVTCHDPHIGLHPSNPDRDMAIRLQCENCHMKETKSFENSSILHYDAGITCEDCHMPKASKSAVAIGTYEADVATHLWRINTDANAEMFTPDGKFANGYLTLNFACSRCHPAKTLGELSSDAANVHE
ncbi:MAG: hypothetical protein GTO51_08465 [Candidatus Latescibacteria bacterium]|nr:hypothetical protein [Candidatus Latescibacterota bacterium]NIM21986.1 hypothetical protein [Candidatus Latescibacterota bacterium]NIM66004.1 hypothetical protein [Candidatus Latescibacterota bacterium]NIO02412.1 hypothetical protein [Candidatus Latescibacterota bacterium]NIO29323.1 hypothetical protein [Candidatus Latescibacterota bacterium]